MLHSFFLSKFRFKKQHFNSFKLLNFEKYFALPSFCTIALIATSVSSLTTQFLMGTSPVSSLVISAGTLSLKLTVCRSILVPSITSCFLFYLNSNSNGLYIIETEESSQCEPIRLAEYLLFCLISSNLLF